MRRRYCGARPPQGRRDRVLEYALHMGRRTSWYGCLPFLVLAAALVGVTPGEAVSFALTDRDREQAVRAGKKSIVAEEFGTEWRLKDASGQTLGGHDAVSPSRAGRAQLGVPQPGAEAARTSRR